jgi:hypothetical protein
MIRRVHPTKLAESQEGANLVRASVRRSLAMRGEEGAYNEKHVLQIRRGPYVATRVLTESISERSVSVDGTYIDLFDANLPIVQNPVILTGTASLLYELNSSSSSTIPGIIVSSSRIRDENAANDRFQFVSEAPAGIIVSTRLRLAKEPIRVTADGKDVIARNWDPDSRTLLIRHAGIPDGAQILIEEGT